MEKLNSGKLKIFSKESKTTNKFMNFPRIPKISVSLEFCWVIWVLNDTSFENTKSCIHERALRSVSRNYHSFKKLLDKGIVCMSLHQKYRSYGKHKYVRSRMSLLRLFFFNKIFLPERTLERPENKVLDQPRNTPVR